MEPITRNLLPRVSYKRGVFGEGVLISRVDGKAFISVADGANSVVEDVITTVFNNSYFLDVHFSIHDQDVFYFVKDNSLKIRDDMDELRRLSGKFNVSQDETNDQGLEVSCVRVLLIVDIEIEKFVHFPLPLILCTRFEHQSRKLYLCRIHRH